MKRFITYLLFALPVVVLAQTPARGDLQDTYDLTILSQQIDSISQASKGKERPVIGIGLKLKDNHDSMERNYSKVVMAAGGVPLMLPVCADVAAIDQMLSVVDGLVVPGGEDVLPLFYGEEPDVHFGSASVERDYFEIILIRLAKSRRIPILSVCRGMQVTNVALGGTLYQDIPSSNFSPKIQHGQWSAGTAAHHTISIDPTSRLYKLLGSKAAVNSFHHQCVKQPAPGMRITATAPDGVPEAMEGDNILCIQFHPEGMFMEHPEMLRIYQDLVERAQQYHQSKKH